MGNSFVLKPAPRRTSLAPERLLCGHSSGRLNGRSRTSGFLSLWARLFGRFNLTPGLEGIGGAHDGPAGYPWPGLVEFLPHRSRRLNLG